MADKLKPPPLHPKQQEIYDNNSRFICVAAGRRFGKTRLLSLMSIEMAHSGGYVWWIAPVHKIANPAWREMNLLTSQIQGVRPNKTEKHISFPSGGFIQLHSLESPTVLRGDGLDLMVLDEFAFAKDAQNRWEYELRPTLSDRLGRAVFISTPNGKNYFWDLYKRGVPDPATGLTPHDNWRSFTFPSNANPFFAQEEFEAVRLELPQQQFEQEYLAMFNDIGGKLFNLEDAHIADVLQEEAIEGHRYTVGVDLGRSKDFTVFTCVDVTEGHVVALKRFNKIDFRYQIQQLVNFCVPFEPKLVIVENNSIGTMPYEEIKRTLPYKVKSFTTSKYTKQDIIDALILAFDNNYICIPDDQELINELLSMRGRRLRTGYIQYNAPSGKHDDMVMSLAFAWEGYRILTRKKTKGRVRRNFLYN